MIALLLLLAVTFEPAPPFPLDTPYPLQVNSNILKELEANEHAQLQKRLQEKTFPFNAIFVGVLLIAVIAFLMTRKKKKKVVKQELKIPKGLEKKELYLALGNLTRKILQERYRIPALYQTTQEIQKEALNKKISQFLIEADLVKFAQKPIDQAQVEKAKTLVQDLLKAQPDTPSCTPET